MYFAWVLVALTVLVIGRIDPLVYFQSGFSVIPWIPFGLLALIGNPASTFLVVAGIFFFGLHKSKGRKLVVTVSILFVAVSLSALTIYQATAVSGKGISQYLAVFLFLFSVQVFYGTWWREPTLSRPSFKTSGAASFGVLVASSTVLFVIFGQEATYRDPVPLGLLAACGLFLILVESLRLKYVVRIVIASLSSLALVVFLFFTFGFALSMGFSFNPDYSWSTLISVATLTNLILAVVSLLLFQITYAALRRQKSQFGK